MCWRLLPSSTFHENFLDGYLFCNKLRVLVKRNILLLKTEKNTHFKNMLLVIRKNNSEKWFIRVIRKQDLRVSPLEYTLSKIASSKWTKLQIFSEDAICQILVFCYKLEAANLKYHNSWNKNFTNFKGLKESRTDLAFLLKSQALHFTHLSL